MLGALKEVRIYSYKNEALLSKRKLSNFATKAENATKTYSFCNYRVLYQRIDQDDYFHCVLKQVSFFEAAGAIAKICWALNQTTITKLSLSKSLTHSVALMNTRVFKHCFLLPLHPEWLITFSNWSSSKNKQTLFYCNIQHLSITWALGWGP